MGKKMDSDGIVYGAFYDTIYKEPLDSNESHSFYFHQYGA